jgi:hypothetical protein
VGQRVSLESRVFPASPPLRLGAGGSAIVRPEEHQITNRGQEFESLPARRFGVTLEPFQRVLSNEKPFAEQMDLERGFLT